VLFLLERVGITRGGNVGNKKTGVAVAKDWMTSRMMFFQGGEYVTPPTGTSFVLAIV